MEPHHEKKIPLIEKENIEHKNYLELRTIDLLDEFGKGNHIPGSGSAGALSALLAIEMMKTVLQLSLSKPDYKENWTEFEYMLKTLNEEHKPKFIELFNADISEFHKVSYLRRQRDKMEIGSRERDKFSRDAMDQLKVATEIPMNICELSFNLLTNFALPIFETGFKSAKGDSGVAISNLLSAISGSLFVVFLNLKSFKKGKWKDEKMNTAVQLAKQYTDIQRKAYSKVVEMYNESSNDTEPQLAFDF